MGALEGTKESDSNDNADTDVNRANKNIKENLPIDRGWAWVILFACSFHLFIAVSWFKCFGIFFVELQRRFKSSSSATSLIFSLQNGCFSITAFCVMTVGKSMSSRVSVTIGAIMVSIGFLLTAFAPSLSVVYITDGVMIGMFFAFMQPHIMTMLNTYFMKYRGLANNIAAAFVSVGALAMAPLYTKLFEHYGFTGTYIISAGIMFNMVIAAMLLRPMEFYKKRIPTVQEFDMDKSENMVLIEANGDVSQGDNPNHPYGGSTVSLASPGLQHAGVMHNSITDVRSPELNGEESTVSNGKADISCANKVVNAIKQVPVELFKTGLLKKRVFLYYILCTMFICSGCIIAEVYIGPHAADMGMDNERVAMLISTLAIADLCAKVFVGYLSDRKWIQRSTIMAIAAIALGIISFFLYFMSTFWTLLVFAILIGILQPVYFALYAVVAIDILSLEELQGALGFLSLAQGAAAASCMPVAGYLRDVSGRYYATFWFGGSLLIVGGLLCFFLPNVKTMIESKPGHLLKSVDEEKANKQSVAN